MALNITNPTYLDCNATTPLDPDVREEMMRFFDIEFGNPGSRTHVYGTRAKVAVNEARRHIAKVVHALPEDVIFTSGATESNNIAILGLAHDGRKKGLTHVVTTQIEHKAVLEPCQRLGEDGFEVTVVAPNEQGWVEPTAIAAAVRPETLLMSVMQVNNETGVVQPIAEIAEALAEHACYFHIDAAQGFGKELAGLRSPRIDLISISGHKIYAPKGIGALIMKRRRGIRPPLRPIMVGGGQEAGLRSGTLPAPLIVALGKAAELALCDHEARRKACEDFKARALEALEPFGIQMNGDLVRTLPSTLNFSIPGIDSEALMVALKDVIAVSNGSACTSNSYELSHVLLAMGLSEERASGALRLSWCHMTPKPDWSAVAAGIRQML
ncbi:MAG: cysteine desulfurase DndA [Alphaproteobacteria bacterium]|nr:cysteine desulfurase DndA [Alphaproteobacteria bacterium]